MTTERDKLLEQMEDKNKNKTIEIPNLTYNDHLNKVLLSSLFNNMSFVKQNAEKNDEEEINEFDE